MPTLDVSMVERGPVPGPTFVTLKSEEAGTTAEHVNVTFGATDGGCKLCGATDFLLGWSQGRMLLDKLATINLYVPMWKGTVKNGSGAISFGNTLECAASGQVSLAVVGSGNTIAGKAMQASSSEKTIIFIPVVAAPTAASS